MCARFGVCVGRCLSVCFVRLWEGGLLVAVLAGTTAPDEDGWTEGSHRTERSCVCVCVCVCVCIRNAARIQLLHQLSSSLGATHTTGVCVCVCVCVYFSHCTLLI